ncbi:hypothetical protein [Dictyobacter arantiisoli]|uniref:Uncharacterized protein n=1 Tax=Dictyobacter arantiisoli TaxID=2014874 RepID=A0A5A5TAD8_9CHLR|nr:hypothetical protein [Dictyobacter arantiisoli]GCF07864.1 hypothetical protein KDI_14280 [Dictyobacter arantiisoli]
MSVCVFAHVQCYDGSGWWIVIVRPCYIFQNPYHICNNNYASLQKDVIANIGESQRCL